MNIKKIYPALFFFLFLACGEHQHKDGRDHHEGKTGHKEEGGNQHAEAPHVELTPQQFKMLKMKIDTIGSRNLSDYIEATGELHLPPQNDAVVTTVVGGTIASIEVLIGDRVKKGQPLAYLSHPNIVEIQSNYVKAYSDSEFLREEFERQRKLYENGVGSGMNFQKAEAAYKASQGNVLALEAQVKQLGISVEHIQQGNISNRVALRSPISGYVQTIEAKTGQYVAPQTPVFEVVDTDHVHVDLRVYEKDAHKVAIGQKVHFMVPSSSKIELMTEIYTISKAFEENPRAIHVHAEIPKTDIILIPGSFVQGRIEVGNAKNMALPQTAVVEEDGKNFVFMADRQDNGWVFNPVEITVNVQDAGWVGISFREDFPRETQFAHNNAYYLMAEMKKGEVEHGH
ncbi:efflux RND transporter periplasmic adaptor subunit [Flavobacteriaceae bacterium GF1]